MIQKLICKDEEKDDSRVLFYVLRYQLYVSEYLNIIIYLIEQMKNKVRLIYIVLIEV